MRSLISLYGKAPNMGILSIFSLGFAAGETEAQRWDRSISQHLLWVAAVLGQTPASRMPAQRCFHLSKARLTQTYPDDAFINREWRHICQSTVNPG